MSDEQLVNQTVKHLVEDLDFVTPNEVIGGFVVRATKAYPVYDVGYQEPLKLMKEYISGIENLQYIGRGGSFRYNNTDHSIETGMLAAKNILGEKHDLESVNADEEYHEIKRERAAAVAARS
jgi:protoporphyrinogen oxidase